MQWPEVKGHKENNDIQNTKHKTRDRVTGSILKKR